MYLIAVVCIYLHFCYSVAFARFKLMGAVCDYIILIEGVECESYGLGEIVACGWLSLYYV